MNKGALVFVTPRQTIINKQPSECYNAENLPKNVNERIFSYVHSNNVRN